MIKVSETAKKKIVELMTDDGFNPANDFVRVGVKSGGCSGLSYDLKFDSENSENEIVAIVKMIIPVNMIFLKHKIVVFFKI